MNKILETYNHLNNLLVKSEVTMQNGNTFPVSLTPYFIKQEKYNKLKEYCEKLLEAIEIFTNIYIENEQIQEKFPELTNIRKLSCVRPNDNKLLQYARFDLIEDQNGNFKILEPNCACPGGILLTPTIKNLLRELPYHKNELKNYNIIEQEIDDESYFFNFLIKLYKEQTGSLKEPVIAYLHSRFRTVTSDLVQFLSIASKLGIKAVKVFIEDIICKDGLVYCGNQKIDIGHSKYEFFVDEQQMVHPCFYQDNISESQGYITSVTNNYFLHVNPFPAILVAENKKVLALIQDPDFTDNLTPAQNTAIQILCPKTFILDSKSNNFKLAVSELKNNKDQYVIKSSMDTRARGVYIGKLCDENTWNNLIVKAIDGPYIMQEYIPSRQENVSIPESTNNTMMNTTLAMYLIGGKASGILCRSSPQLTTNLYASGVFRPAFVLK